MNTVSLFTFTEPLPKKAQQQNQRKAKQTTCIHGPLPRFELSPPIQFPLTGKNYCIKPCSLYIDVPYMIKINVERN